MTEYGWWAVLATNELGASAVLGSRRLTAVQIKYRESWTA